MSSTRSWRTGLALTVLATVLVVGGCGSSPVSPEPGSTTDGPATVPATPSATSSAPSSATPPPGPSPAASTATPSPTVAGVTLRALGFEHGPLDAFSLPHDLVVSTSVDQPNVVTIVLASPPPAAVESYLRDTLPREGFTIDARADTGEAMTFEGHGWSGAFTGSGATSAVVLRPA